MSDESSQSIPEQPTEVIARKFMDNALVDYVCWANNGIYQPISITVGGTIYSGNLISGAKWCDEMINFYTEKAGNSDEIKEAMRQYYNGLKDHKYSGDIAPEQIAMIHMNEVKIIQAGNVNVAPLRLWRFKIEEIDGFSPGAIPNG